MTTLINLTQHNLTDEQKEGFQVLETIEDIKRALTFDEIPTMGNIAARAKALATIAKKAGAAYAVIGGAPYLMSALEEALLEKGIRPIYAFSIRESIEVTGPDGQVTKTSVFKHAGWIEVRR
nr:MAG TPA: hypothetical protein [Caudoviricetes sp.]